MKPVKTETLLRAIRRMTAQIALLLLLACGALRAQTSEFRFQVQQRAEMVAALTLASPGSDWSQPGREGSLAVLTLDGKEQQNLMVTGAPRIYRIFLGELAAGSHTLKVERHATWSAAGAGLTALSARITEAKDDYTAHAPIVLARLNTVGQFTDVPLAAYCTRGRDASGEYLEYTVIFSNEDGGTSTRDLMARWGRTTDIEYIYRVWLDAAGNPKQTLIQTRDHVDIPYDGLRVGRHPVLMPVTDNNMVEPAGAGAAPIRYQLAPALVDLSLGSREQVMDSIPATYRISAQELVREEKLRAFGTFDGEKISDPRNYLVVEYKANSANAGLQILVRTPDGAWHASALGLGKNFIDRSGWVRTTIELKPGTRAEDLKEIGAECLSLRDLSRQPVPKNGRCAVESFGRIFFLGHDYVPQAPIAAPKAGWQLPVGGIISAPLR